jgi:predicted transcriptional regulator
MPYKDAWLLNNRGALGQIARRLGVSRQAVSRVYRGEGTSARIEEALRAVRAPGFEELKKKPAPA